MVLEVCGISKSFKTRRVLDNVSFTVDSGDITGFLGPNGAGKTTAIKIILGLLHADCGTVRICGHDITFEHELALANVGAIVESPDLYTYLTGRENLMQFARICGVSADRVTAVADMVKLSGRLDEKVKGYSLGMKQRLGIAQALLTSPKLLILDEPTNGLDPEGIKDLRDILRSCAANGCAVLVSSHQLSEMQLMCTRVCIIENGHIVATCSTDELTSRSAETRAKYIFNTSDTQKTLEILLRFDPDAHIEDKFASAMLTAEMSAAAIREAVGALIDVYTVTSDHPTLEDAYLEITRSAPGQIA